MADNVISVKVTGVDELKRSLLAFPVSSERYLAAAGREASERVILPTVGLRTYPQSTAANEPPTPYYIRGRGTQRTRGGSEYNDARSERLGTQWYTQSKYYGTEIGNRASYARWAYGNGQARAMERIGWRKLVDVVTEKMTEITAVYNKWVDKLLKDVHLK